ncbi:MAG: hypothetical protein K2L96_07510 [Muribaculaceae bacterium]|nr:hypothetical protein [Muribaculaceae bacterium]
MKKIYFLALAASVALSASADKSGFAGMPSGYRSGVFQVKELPNETRKAAPAKAVQMDVLEKVNLWSFYSLLHENYGAQSQSMSISIDDEATGAISLTLGLPGNSVLSGTFNTATGELSIPNMQYLGKDNDGPVYFYYKEIDEQDEMKEGASSIEAATAYYTNGEFTFDSDIIWAIGDPDNEEVSWYVLCMSNVFSSITAQNSSTFRENIVYPMFSGGQENTQDLETEVRQTADNVIAIVDPFRATYILKKYESKSPNMVLDITDPANVLVKQQSTGLWTEAEGVIYYYSNSWYKEEHETDEVFIPIVMYKDESGNVTITFPNNSVSLYGSTTQVASNGSLFPSVLKYTVADSGVGSVAVEDGEGAVSYYNLQGARLEKPTRGILIRVHGGKAEKIVIR